MTTEKRLSDAEVICEFMEPIDRTTGPFGNVSNKGWWRFVRNPKRWEPLLAPGAYGAVWWNTLTLDRLHEVQARLGEEQWHQYIRMLAHLLSPPFAHMPIKEMVHASAEQKLAALASVLRAAVEAK